MINDATSVVLLGAVARVFPAQALPSDGAESDHHDPSANLSGGSLLFGILANFVYLFSTSLCLGLGTGLGISFLLRRWKCQGPHHVRKGDLGGI